NIQNLSLDWSEAHAVGLASRVTHRYLGLNVRGSSDKLNRQTQGDRPIRIDVHAGVELLDPVWFEVREKPPGNTDRGMRQQLQSRRHPAAAARLQVEVFAVKMKPKVGGRERRPKQRLPLEIRLHE